MPNLSIVAALLSAAAIFLSVISIRRQSIPSKYEAERRVREKFKIPNGELQYEYNDVTYYISYITIARHSGLSHRVKELVLGDISAETQVVFTLSSQTPSTIDSEFISTIDEEGVRALIFKMDTTEPTELYNEFSDSVFELSKRIR